MASATDEKVKDKASASGKREPKGKRPNPVALEVPVSVAGARPASAQDKRELFTEETTTVVVFPDGAVIQLSAAVTVGQLLFLTDKRTKKEMVCQVVHKRSHRPTTCYVELEFTEEVRNFWGVSFPAQEEKEERPPTAEAVEAEETTEDDRSEPPAAPKTEDVAQLKEEVEELRAQLRELKEKQAKEEKPAAENADAQTRRLAEAELAARAAAESEAKERAEEMDRKARANAARLAEEARQKLAQAQSQAQTQKEAPNPPAVEEEDRETRRLAEAELAARAAAESEAAARAAAGGVAKQDLWAKDEESKRASEEARKWELEAIENERKRKQEERERREVEEAERARRESGKTEPEKEEQAEAPAPPAPATVSVPTIGMRLPSAAPLASVEAQAPKAEVATAAASSAKEVIDPLEELLPKPALDFSKAPKGLDPNDPYNIYKPMRRKAGWGEIGAAAVIVVILVGGGGFAWYKNKLPFFHRGPKVEEATKSVPVAKPAAAAPNAAPAISPANATTAPAGGQPTDNGAAGASANGTNATTAAVAMERAPEAPTATKTDASAAPPEEKASEKKAAASKPSAKKESSAKTASSKSGNNHGKAETSSESKPKAEEAAVADNTPVTPAKLLHSVTPVYPPDAMLNYITGDVRIEAVVDAMGHIGAMQVLVGPGPLRQAAMDALKQYEYEPATQGGKAVASKVTVTIKFWFDP